MNYPKNIRVAEVAPRKYVRPEATFVRAPSFCERVDYALRLVYVESRSLRVMTWLLLVAVNVACSYALVSGLAQAWDAQSW